MSATTLNQPSDVNTQDRPPRPVALVPRFDAIPAELRAKNQLVMWRYEWVDGRWTKPPYTIDGRKADSTDNRTWTTFEQAKAAYMANRFDGIGLVHLPEDNLTGIDIDHCRDPITGLIDADAAAIIQEIDSYTEVSPSGTGIRIFAKGPKPSRERSRAGKVEVYDGTTKEGKRGGRFLTLTGHNLEGAPTTINERQPQIERLYYSLFSKQKPQAGPQAEPTNKADKPHTKEAADVFCAGTDPATRKDADPMDPAKLTDDEIIAAASAASEKFRRLMSGDFSDYPSQSEGDQALADIIAAHVRGDYARTERIFGLSKLAERQKWKERADYRASTIGKAVQSVKAGWTPSRNGKHARHSDTQTPGAATEIKRTAILVTTDEKEVNDQTITALASHPNIYQRGNLLVGTVQDVATDKRIKRPPGSIRIVPFPSVAIREMATEVALFQKKEKDGKDDSGKSKWKIVPCRPPQHAAAQITARGQWDGIRQLVGITETPILRADGTILDKPGWDEASGLLYVPSCDFPAIPGGMTLADAIDAAKFIMAIVDDFPFAAPHHKAAWLSALLTVFARHAINGPCPLFLFDANVAGSGKSLLCDLIAILATVREMPRVAWRDEDAEVRKTITAIVMAGERFCLWDNVGPDQTLGCPALDAALTGQTWQDRVLGVSQMTAVLPLVTVHFASGNNVALGGDTERRTILCRLESPLENPDERSGFKIPNLIAHVIERRAELVCKALVMLRAYCQAGRPQPQGLTPFGSFEAWSDLVRGCVLWASGIDPAQGKADLRKANIKKNYLAPLIEAWQSLPNSKSGVTAADAIKIVRLHGHEDHLAPLRAIFAEWAPNGELPTAAELGYRLREYRGRVVGGKRFDCVENRNGVRAWRVESAT